MSNMLEDERFDGMLLNFAQQCQGIEPLLDTLFSFVRRKTDFFRSGDDEKAKNMVLKMLEKHQSLADKTNAQKKKLSADAEGAAQKRKAAAKAKREAARAKAASTPPPAPVVAKAPAPPPSEDKENKDANDDDDDKEPPPGNDDEHHALGRLDAAAGGFGAEDSHGKWHEGQATVRRRYPQAVDQSGIEGPAPGARRRTPQEGHRRRLLLDARGRAPELGEKEIVIALQKEDKQMWWKNVIVGDPEINTQKVQPENSKLS